MIIVDGTAYLRLNFKVELDMSVEEFDALSERQQDQAIEDAINWSAQGRNIEIENLDVDDVEEA